VNEPLPPLPPRPAADGGLPPLPPRPGATPTDRTTELPRVSRPPAAPPPTPGGLGGRAATDAPTAPIPIARGRRRRAPRALAIAGIVAVSATAGAISARVAGPDDAPSASAARTTPVAATQAEARLQDAVRTAAPSVVEVRTPFGQGSGVIVAPQGLVVTNQHVVQGSRNVEIITASGASVPAEVLASDEFQDLAVLRPQTSPGPGVALVDAAAGPPTIGQSVFAIGSPFGLRNTVTAGVVSAFREDDGRPLIQFDAPVNPGNSGGGLFDLEGRLIGIPTSIQSPIPGNVGLGFAVPTSRVQAMLDRVS
jgi:S1-C subfamily serine protease